MMRSSILVWRPGMPPRETAYLAYWERNMLALRYADGYYDDVVPNPDTPDGFPVVPRYDGWRRVLTLEGGRLTFHVPDEFDVGNLPYVPPNWDGHTTDQKWRRVYADRGVVVP